MKARNLAMMSLVALCLAAPSSAAGSEDRDTSIAKLPRHGYEPLSIRTGDVVIEPSVEADMTYDSNILVTPTNRLADAIFSLRPRVTVDRDGATATLHGEVKGDFIRYAAHNRENVDTFGAALNSTKALGRTQFVITSLAFDRTFEARVDPEAVPDRSLPPALINIASAALQYHYKGPLLGIAADAGVVKLDYLPAADADRDLTTYHASVRGSWNLGNGVAAYIEPYIVYRNFHQPDMVMGQIGDTTTIGGLAGVSFDLSDLLQGHVGAGAFSARPDGARAFGGLAIDGRLTWRPRTRTAIVLAASRGDVATVRVGALGRVDTHLTIAIDQEARHNLILHVAAGGWRIKYQGGSVKVLNLLTGVGEARYLVDRHLSLLARIVYTHRASNVAVERFENLQAKLGVQLVY